MSDPDLITRAEHGEKTVLKSWSCIESMAYGIQGIPGPWVHMHDPEPIQQIDWMRVESNFWEFAKYAEEGPSVSINRRYG